MWGRQHLRLPESWYSFVDSRDDHRTEGNSWNRSCQLGVIVLCTPTGTRGCVWRHMWLSQLGGHCWPSGDGSRAGAQHCVVQRAVPAAESHLAQSVSGSCRAWETVVQSVFLRFILVQLESGPVLSISTLLFRCRPTTQILLCPVPRSLRGWFESTWFCGTRNLKIPFCMWVRWSPPKSGYQEEKEWCSFLRSDFSLCWDLSLF